MVIWAIFLPMLAVEIVFQLGSAGVLGGPEAVGWRLGAMQEYGFFGQLLPLIAERGEAPLGLLIRFFSYAFINASFTQFLFVAVFLLALGKMVASVFRPWAVLVVFLGSAIFGALTYGLIMGERAVLIGGFPAIYGLIGAFTFILWMNLAHQGANPYRAFTLIGVLLGIQLLFGALFGAAPDWIAEVAGFVAGFALSILVSPGGWARLLARLRQR
jgi:membrane associated rhomboid family serine protease